MRVLTGKHPFFMIAVIPARFNYIKTVPQKMDCHRLDNLFEKHFLLVIMMPITGCINLFLNVRSIAVFMKWDTMIPALPDSSWDSMMQETDIPIHFDSLGLMDHSYPFNHLLTIRTRFDFPSRF